MTPALFSVLLVKGRNGKDLLMLDGYTYYQHKILRDGFRWSCTQMGSRSCRGFLHVTNDMFVVRAFTQHTHPPSTFSWKSTKNQKKTNDVSNFLFPFQSLCLFRWNNFLNVNIHINNELSDLNIKEVQTEKCENDEAIEGILIGVTSKFCSVTFVTTTYNKASNGRKFSLSLSAVDFVMVLLGSFPLPIIATVKGTQDNIQNNNLKLLKFVNDIYYDKL